MRALITGDKGFVGKHLRAELESQGVEVFGFDLVDGFDLCNFDQLDSVITKVEPDEIYHLAAQAFVPASFTQPTLTTYINVIGSINVLESVKISSPNTRVLLASSSYADTGSSPYAVSKLSMEHFGQFYAFTYDMDVVITRASNHIGPGQSDDFAVASFAKQIREGKRIIHGNLDGIKNFTDVRDVVRAYTTAIHLRPGAILNVCSDQNVSMKQVLDLLIKLSGKRIKTELDEGLVRPNPPFEPPKANIPGWKPEIPLAQTLRDLL